MGKTHLHPESLAESGALLWQLRLKILSQYCLSGYSVTPFFFYHGFNSNTQRKRKLLTSLTFSFKQTADLNLEFWFSLAWRETGLGRVWSLLKPLFLNIEDNWYRMEAWAVWSLLLCVILTERGELLHWPGYTCYVILIIERSLLLLFHQC